MISGSVLARRELPKIPEPKKDYSAVALDYARRVVADKIIVGPSTKKACQRHLDDREKSKDPDYPYEYCPAKGDLICEFAELMVHIKGKWSAAPEGKLPYIRLEPWQCFFLAVSFGWIRRKDQLRRFREIYAEIPRKNSKALALDTPVPTPDGWKTMGDLNVGDFVFGPDGVPCRVIAATRVAHNHKCFEVIMSDGERIVADEDHFWVTDSRVERDNNKSRKGKIVLTKKRTSEIAKTVFCRNELNHRMPVAAPLSYPVAELEIPPYVLGAWLGDGTSACSTITIGDFDSVEMVPALAAAGAPIRKMNGKMRYSMTSLDRPRLPNGRIGPNGGVCSRLRSLGLLGNKHIPQHYFFGSIEQRMELLRGLMDTDGTISKSGQCVYGTSSFRLASDVVELLWGLGFKPSVHKATAKIKGRIIGPAWHIQFWAYADRPVFKLKRKLARQKPAPLKPMRSMTRQIAACRPVKSVPVRCIQVDRADGQFLVGKTGLITHNSTIGAIIGLFMFVADKESGAEVFAGATSMEQAHAVFKPAWLMVNNNLPFQTKFGIQLGGTVANPGPMVCLKTGSRFAPIIGKPGDGDSPSCAIIDEYHEHVTPVMYDAMKTGMGARTQPMRVIITTAGVDTSGPCYDKHLEAEKVLDGTLENDELFTMIFSAAPEADWKDFGNVWVPANPNYNVSVFEDYLRGQLRDALQNPSQQNINRTKHLNQWMTAGAAWVNLAHWEACCDPTLHLSQFAGKRCWLGADLASKIDIASLALLFRTETGWALFCKHYLPEDTIELPQNAHYRKWRDDDHGWLTQTDGARTDLKRIEDDIKDAAKMFNVQALCFDQKEANYLITNVQEWASFDCVDVPQAPSHMSEPMKEMEALITAGQLKHCGDPVLTWMMGNVVKKQGRGGGPIKSYYPTKQKDKNKIDGVVAAIMALSRAMLAKPEPEYQILFV